MNRNKIIAPILLVAGLSMLTGCVTSKSFTPSHGGQIDTLHNDVHLETYDDLFTDNNKYPKDPTKTYYTDDDGLMYKWDETKQEYVCVSETNTTINFYFDSTQTTDEDGNDCPIFTMKFYLLKPLGECPEAINTVEKVIALGAAHGFAKTEAFPTFIGWSFYSTCLDEEGLWNFTTDYRQQAVTSIYGIWVG